ncbi:hypothetical protein TYRP_003863 [Tyrophagus putrescentiae]|nr:hypothetical protein TYRP_003863 [Tyrophagus putrescentiae]
MEIFLHRTTDLIKPLLGIPIAHWSALVGTLDPKKPLHYIFPFFAILVTYLYGVFGLHYEATGQLVTSLEQFTGSPHVFTHQVVPQMIWPQLDFVILFCDFFAMVGVYLALYFTDPVKGRFRFFLSSDGKTLFINGAALPEAETVKILAARRRLRTVAIAFSEGFHLFLSAFFLGNVWLNDVYRRTLFGNIVFTIFAVRYTRIQQETLLKEFGELIEKVVQRKTMKKRPRPQHHQGAFLQHHWATFTRLNSRLVFLYRAIEDYSRYCDPFLGAIFPYYITVAIMYVAFLECNLFLFATTHECAVIVRYSGGLVRLNRRFAFEFNQKLNMEKNFPSVISGGQDGKDALLRTAEERNRALLKSFEEKRAEYAKARLRILGEEMPQEEVAVASQFNLSEMKEALDQNTTSTSNSSTTTSTPLLPTPSSQPLSAVNNASSANVLRQPTAPDGTRGFHHHHRARS